MTASSQIILPLKKQKLGSEGVPSKHLKKHFQGYHAGQWFWHFKSRRRRKTSAACRGKMGICSEKWQEMWFTTHLRGSFFLCVFVRLKNFCAFKLDHCLYSRIFSFSLGSNCFFGSIWQVFKLVRTKLSII